MLINLFNIMTVNKQKASFRNAAYTQEPSLKMIIIVFLPWVFDTFKSEKLRQDTSQLITMDEAQLFTTRDERTIITSPSTSKRGQIRDWVA